MGIKRKVRSRKSLGSVAALYKEDIGTTGIKTAAISSGGTTSTSIKTLPLTKEEKKARAKAAREAKKKKKKGGADSDDNADDNDNAANAAQVLSAAKDAITADGANKTIEDDGIDHVKADALASNGTICTFSTSRKGVDARARDINVTNFTLQHKGAVMLDETEIVLNHGNR